MIKVKRIYKNPRRVEKEISMPVIFKATEILKTAIRIEENGIIFYREMIKKV